MEEKVKNLCAPIPAGLHARVREAQEASGQTLGQYMTWLIQTFYDNQKEETTMSGDKRTVAFQVPGELFEKFKDYLQEKGIKQNAFFLDCIHRALADAQEEREDAANEGHAEQEGCIPEEAAAVSGRASSPPTRRAGTPWAPSLSGCCPPAPPPTCIPSTTPAAAIPMGSTSAMTTMVRISCWIWTAAHRTRPTPACSSWATPGPGRSPSCRSPADCR